MKQTQNICSITKAWYIKINLRCVLCADKQLADGATHRELISHYKALGKVPRQRAESVPLLTLASSLRFSHTGRECRCWAWGGTGVSRSTVMQVMLTNIDQMGLMLGQLFSFHVDIHFLFWPDFMWIKLQGQRWINFWNSPTFNTSLFPLHQFCNVYYCNVTYVVATCSLD